MKTENPAEISIFISRSSITTEVNKTGSWRYMRPKYEEKTAPCSAACPAGEDIARIEMLAGRGLFTAAAETIMFENPFPAVCGRVCFHPCESACNRSELDQPVAVRQLERFIGDMVLEAGLEPALDKAPDNGRKVCIVGSGPAGLAAGYFLMRLGFSCDLFESAPEPGGLLRWGIPPYRLPPGVLKSEIERIENLGLKIHCRTPVTPRFLEEARSRYDAFFIGCGLSASLRMNIPGEELAADGLEFLNGLGRGERSAVKGCTAVIGGGNTAVDVARSLVRLGAAPIIVYRRRRRDMPAFNSEVTMAVDEGIKIMELAAPVRIDTDQGDLLLTWQPMKAVDIPTGGGRARVAPDNQSPRHLRVSSVFTAIGAQAIESWQLPPEENKACLKLSHCTLADQDQPVVFGGDLTNPVKSVTDAVASGKQAALALDVFFKKGREAVAPELAACRVGSGPALSMESYMGSARAGRNPHIVSYTEINTDYFRPRSRSMPPLRIADDRRQSFVEIEETLTADQATAEISRCFNCGICNQCDNCRVFCPEVAVFFQDDQRRINLEYCKGCGICVVECPRNAMALEEEI